MMFQEAAKLGKEANPREMWLTHYSPSLMHPEEYLNEIQMCIRDSSKADFRKRFVGSYFGVVWMFIQPIVTVLIYWLIFGPIGFKSAPPVPNASYVQWLVPGIAPWFFFSEALNCGTGCLQEYNYLVKKVVFKVEILPVIKLILSLIHI